MESKEAVFNRLIDDNLGERRQADAPNFENSDKFKTDFFAAANRIPVPRHLRRFRLLAYAAGLLVVFFVVLAAGLPALNRKSATPLYPVAAKKEVIRQVSAESPPPAVAWKNTVKIKRGKKNHSIVSMACSAPRKDLPNNCMSPKFFPSADTDSASLMEPTRRREEFNTEEYKNLRENPFAVVGNQPLSTFGADVDTAS